MEIAELLYRARVRVGFSQSLLARVSGVAQPKLSAYESGREVPSGRTLARVLAAAGATLALSAPRVAPGDMAASARRSLVLHRSVAARLLDASEVQRGVLLDDARRGLDVAREANPHGGLWHDQWDELLAGPLDELVAALVGENAHAVELRATSPFASVLDARTRDEVVTRAP